MKSSSVTASFSTNSLTANLLRRGVLRQLARLQRGQLVVTEGEERHVFGAAGAVLQGQIDVVDAATWGMVASNGSIGAGEAFIHGYWTSPDLTAVIRVLVSNLEVLDAM
jgi:cyclopropane-fatty-acyl-phospholipid synthase